MNDVRYDKCSGRLMEVRVPIIRAFRSRSGPVGRRAAQMDLPNLKLAEIPTKRRWGGGLLQLHYYYCIAGSQTRS